MAVKASAQVTVSRLVDIDSVVRYYLLQSSTLGTPAKPTTKPPPSAWKTTEPSYTEGATNTLYVTDLTVFTNGTYKYSEVSKSSSYEAAKTAYNKAQAAETGVKQNKDAIALCATKKEVQAVDGKFANYYTKAEYDASLKVQADRITANVKETTALGEKVSTVEQTAQGLTVQLGDTNKKVSTAQSTAYAANSTANTAQGTANAAKTDASNAAKTATNYMNFSTDGLVVGDMTAAKLGRNIQVTNDSVRVRAGTTILAEYGDTYVRLGKNSKAAKIDLCNGTATMYNDPSDNAGFTYNRLRIDAGHEIALNTKNAINLGVNYDVDTYANLHMQSAIPWGSGGQNEIPYMDFNVKNGTKGAYLRLLEGTMRLGSQTGTKEASVETDVGGILHLYGASIGVHNRMDFHASAVAGNEISYCGRDTFGAERGLLTLSSSNNCVLGYGVKDTGNSNIYGQDVNLCPTLSGTAFHPYYRGDDTLSIRLDTAGYLTSSNKNVVFTVPLSAKAIGIKSVSVSSVDGLQLRQENKYTHGSSSSAYAKPSSYTAVLVGSGNHIRVTAVMAKTDNSVNNAAIGIVASIKITFK